MIRPHILESLPGVRCALTTKEDERHSHPPESLSPSGRLAILSRGLGIQPERLAIPRQCHTASAQVVSEAGTYEATDALVTRSRGLWLQVVVADCIPIFLVDSSQPAVAVIHAGWRGLSRGIVRNTVKLLMQNGGGSAETMTAYVGPGAGVCCYEVGTEVAAEFDREVVVSKNGKMYLDLKEAAAVELRAEGVRPGRMEISPYCTICASQTFHSYRRDKELAGRMVCVISLSE